ncbi:hypothetical protein SAMN05661091_5031 [Paenibacillus uliginis N3/975]|uniref:Uncharacterized protein n=1 Tax=Paenibacillus uliginis N3/975 TaxID=1313296 RepID=A0A1X7HP93_9BACL|nr:hypothetical protein [Paenibacillus uliginis]SMF90415.1 hypothetical protein SAMN05661091_5031 [Paenibacillus uliginis N3/975]
MLLDTKNKKMIFYIAMIVLWGATGVAYTVKKDLLLSLISFALVLGIGVKLYNTIKDSHE